MNRVTMRASLLFFLVASAGSHSTAHPSHHDGDPVDRRKMDHHFAEPEKFAEAWNDPSRDAWQVGTKTGS